MTRIMVVLVAGTGCKTSRPWMILLVHLSEVLPVHVGVNLCRRDVGVAEHLLHRAEVRPALEKVGGERVAQCVGRYGLGNSRLLDVPTQDLPGAHARQRLATGVEEQHAFAAPLLEPRA